MGSAGGWQKGTLRACRGSRKPLSSERRGLASVYCFTAITTAVPPTTQLAEAGVTGLQPQANPDSSPSSPDPLPGLPTLQPELRPCTPATRLPPVPSPQPLAQAGPCGIDALPFRDTWFLDWGTHHCHLEDRPAHLPASPAAGGPAPGFLVQRALMLLAWGPPFEEPSSKQAPLPCQVSPETPPPPEAFLTFLAGSAPPQGPQGPLVGHCHVIDCLSVCRHSCALEHLEQRRGTWREEGRGREVSSAGSPLPPGPPVPLQLALHPVPLNFLSL